MAEHTENFLVAIARCAEAAELAAFVAVAERPEPAAATTVGNRGIPLIVKDNIDVAGWESTAASPALAGLRPRDDAPVVRALKAAGYVVVARTNMHELAFGVTSANTAHGAVRNPWNTQRLAGGSSGGTAAAVAAGCVANGLGSDTGGSVRIPAALCGIVGFRPSSGRWPGAGVVPLSRTRDTAGPMARDVARCAAMDAAVCGVDDAEPAAMTISQLRLGRPLRWLAGAVQPDVLAVFNQALDRLKAAGATVVDIEPGSDLDLAAISAAGMTIVQDEAIPSLREYLRLHDQEMNVVAFVARIASADVKGIFGSLQSLPAVHHAQAEHARAVQRPRFQQAAQALFDHYGIHAIATPCTPVGAARWADMSKASQPESELDLFAEYTRFATLASVLGLPSITLPMGLDHNGMPLGLLLDGPARQDRALLRCAAAVEAVLPAIGRPPLWLGGF